jgi:hypothetical protein
MSKPKSIDDYPVPYVILGLFMACALWNLFYPSSYLILYSGVLAGVLISFILRKGTSHQSMLRGL